MLNIEQNVNFRMEVTMYDKLLLLPLFQGLGKQDFTTILEKAKFHFRKYAAGSIIAEQGSKCNAIVFVLDGEVTSEKKDERYGYSLTEYFDKPFVMEPHSLFGMYPSYTATYTAQTDISVVSIEKADILSVLNRFEIFQMNYLNLLSNHVQRLTLRLWDIHSGNTTEKVANFLLKRCLTPKGKKKLRIRMEDFAELTGETRISISKALNTLKAQKLIALSRKEITIPDLEKLTNDIQP